MKFKLNDQVIVTRGKDKGKKGKITRILPNDNKVVVEGVNLYVKHVKPMPMINRAGERTVQERPLDLGKIAILNEKGAPDRIGYKITADGKKIRVYKKTGTEIKKTVIKTKKTQAKGQAKDNQSKKEAKKNKKSKK